MAESKNEVPNAPSSVMWRIVAAGVLGQIVVGVVGITLSTGIERWSPGSAVFFTGFLPWMMAALFGANMAYKRGFADAMKPGLGVGIRCRQTVGFVACRPGGASSSLATGASPWKRICPPCLLMLFSLSPGRGDSRSLSPTRIAGRIRCRAV